MTAVVRAGQDIHQQNRFKINPFYAIITMRLDGENEVFWRESIMNRLARAVVLGIMCSLVTNHISAVAPQDKKIGRLIAEWRLVKKGINATIKGLKGRTLTQDERASRISLAKQVGILLGLIAIASGVYKKIRTIKPEFEAVSLDPKQWTKDQMKLFNAVSVDKDIKKVNKLLKQVDLNTMIIIATDKAGRSDELSLLHWVIARSGIPLDIVKALIAKANLETRDSFLQETPLHFAVSHNKKDVVEALIEAGASLEAKDYKKRTPLSLARKLDLEYPSKGYSKIAKLLQDRGAPE